MQNGHTACELASPTQQSSMHGMIITTKPTQFSPLLQLLQRHDALLQSVVQAGGIAIYFGQATPCPNLTLTPTRMLVPALTLINRDAVVHELYDTMIALTESCVHHGRLILQACSSSCVAHACDGAFCGRFGHFSCPRMLHGVIAIVRLNNCIITGVSDKIMGIVNDGMCNGLTMDA